MTRKEAIDCLEGLKIYLKAEHIDQEVLDMAIEALEKEPTTRCKECKYYRLCNEDTHLIACGYEWCAWWQRRVISTGYCHCGAKMDGDMK